MPITVTQGMQEAGAEQRGRADPLVEGGYQCVRMCACAHTPMCTL